MISRKKFKIIFLSFTLILLLSCLTSIYAGNNTSNTTHNSTSTHSIVKVEDKNNIKTDTHKVSTINLTVNDIKTHDYLTNTTINGQIKTQDNKLPNSTCIHLYVDNKKVSNKTFTLEKTGKWKYTTTQTIGTHTFKISINDTKYEKKSTTKKFTITEKIFPILDKKRPIYFAMDHTNTKDKQIRDNIVNKLKQEGFNVKRYTIGPNAMYQNIVYIYNHKITNAILFHLFNGVDPANIREVASNGNDNRGRIVRQRGNSAVLAWFYDSSDPVHPGGTCYTSVRASETSKKLAYPKKYMDQNNIYSICTSSDNKKHKNTADYNGDKTTLEFMKLFTNNKNLKYKTTTTAQLTIEDNTIIINGTVKYPTSTITGYTYIKDSTGKTIKDNIPVQNNKFNTQIRITKQGIEKYTITYKESTLYASSNTTKTATLNIKNATITVKQYDKKIDNNSIQVTLKEPQTGEYLGKHAIQLKYDNKTLKYETNDNGNIYIRTNLEKNTTITINALHNNKIINTTYYRIITEKVDTIVTVEKISGIIGENIHLKAHITDTNNKAVDGGNLVFKLNGKTLKTDNRFDTYKDALKLKVANGSVDYVIPASLYMRNAKNVTASYSGTSKYNSNSSGSVSAAITKRHATLNVSVSPNSARQYTSIIFRAVVGDTRTGNTSLVHEDAYVIFKVNNKTLRDKYGKNILVKVNRDNVASYSYTVPRGMGGINKDNSVRDYIVSAVYVNPYYYPDTRASSVFNVIRENISINIAHVRNVDDYLFVSASIHDYKGSYVVGDNSVVLKVNGKTLRFANNTEMLFVAHDGRLSVNVYVPGVKVKSLMIVTGARQAYLGGRNMTSNIIRVK